MTTDPTRPTADLHVVVVGGGVAAVECIQDLRASGWAGTITLVSDENHPPYQRPPLSKSLFAAAEDLVLPLRPQSFYNDHQVDMRLGHRVSFLDRANKVVVLDSQERIPYTHLVLATGSAPRRLDVPGEELPRVHYLRGTDDAYGLQKALMDAKKIVLIGGGFIGLEVAASALEQGIAVTLLERNPRLLQRAISAEMSEWIHIQHRDSGLVTVFSTQVSSIEETTHGVSVNTTDGNSYEADVVLVGIGGAPAVDLAEKSGLPIDNGILVNETLATTDPSVWAVGDCARIVTSSGTSVRIESVQNATDQGRTVASNIVATENGEPLGLYSEVPWFWSTQGAIKLQIAGTVGPVGEIVAAVRQYPKPNKRSVLRFQGERLVAVESVNAPSDHLAARTLLANGGAVDRDTAVDSSIAMKTLVHQVSSV